MMIHPDIKAFWEDADYEVVSVLEEMSDGTKEMLWYARPNDKTKDVLQIALQYADCDMRWYFTESSPDAYYEEDEMLRLVKLKAFL